MHDSQVGEAISIPLWCDCDLLCATPFLFGQGHFNPTMVRLRQCRHSPSPHTSCYFNPTMVRLRPLSSCAYPSSVGGFNPTMVRLRPQEQLELLTFYAPFQSHYGAIATWWSWQFANSPHEVSIPLWCDCDLSPRPSFKQSHHGFQSHYGAIAT